MVWPATGLLILSTLQVLAQTATDAGHEIASELRAGNYAHARELLESALRKSPQDARLWTLNGLALVRLGKEREALESYEHALRISPDYLPALESAAQIEYEAGDDGAADLLKKIVRMRPDDRTSHSMLAALAFKAGDCHTAESEFVKSRPEGTSQIPALEEYGACLMKQKRTADAVPIFQRLSELQPGNRRALYDLAVAHFLERRYENVISILNPTSETAPDANELELLGEAYEATSRTERAMELLRQAIAINPTDSRYYVDFGNVCLAHGAFQLGIDVLSAGVQRVTEAAPVFLARGLLFCELAQFDKGEADFNTAERLDPAVEFGSAVRGLVELQQNNLDDAERIVRERLRSHSNDALLNYLLAETLVKKGAAPGTPEFEEARSAANRAVELQPNLSVARDILARLYFESGNIAGAIEQSRLALKINPKDTAALYRLILALRKSNQTDEVPALMKQLVTLRAQSQMEQGIERNYETAEHAPTH